MPPVFSSPALEPIIIDVLGPDWTTSLLNDGLKMVFHVNPSSVQIQYSRTVERTQTWGGFVETHWGDAATEISLSNTTGGFMRMYSGLTSTTNPSYGGTRRETISYDKYLDFLALFKNNGAVYDVNGTIILNGILKMIMLEGIFLGRFTSFGITESAEKPYQFSLTASFTVEKEIVRWRSTPTLESSSTTQAAPTFSSGPLT